MSNGDRKYNRATYTGLGKDMQDRLIEGAYMSARADSPDYSWMNIIGSGIKSFKEEMDTARANKEAAREEIIAGIEKTMDSIYQTGGSMDTAYYDQAYDYAQDLREQYIASVESGDTKLQHQIKGQLNTFATQITTTKDALTEGAELWKDKSLIPESGMTDYQLAVNASFKPENAQLIDGVFKWKNVMYDPNDPNSKEFFEEKDYKAALPLRDDVNKEAYLKGGQAVLESGDNYKNGEGSDFDVNTQKKKNMQIIDDSIKEVGSIQSMLHDDITGQGSFASYFNEDNPQHPDYESFFENIMTKDGLENVKMIGLYDKSDDGEVGYEDFIDFNSPEALRMFPEFELMDTSKDGIISNDELLAVIKSDPSIEEDIKDLIRPKIKDALLNVDNPSYNEDLTKDMLVDFMTNRQKQMFYGKDGEAFRDIIPQVDENTGKLTGKGNVTFNERKGILKIGNQEIHSIKSLVEAGGNYGYLKDNGFTYDDKEDKWIWNPKFGKGTYIEPVL